MQANSVARLMSHAAMAGGPIGFGLSAVFPGSIEISLKDRCKVARSATLLQTRHLATCLHSQRPARVALRKQYHSLCHETRPRFASH